MRNTRSFTIIDLQLYPMLHKKRLYSGRSYRQIDANPWSLCLSLYYSTLLTRGVAFLFSSHEMPKMPNPNTKPSHHPQYGLYKPNSISYSQWSLISFIRWIINKTFLECHHDGSSPIEDTAPIHAVSKSSIQSLFDGKCKNTLVFQWRRCWSESMVED